MGFFEEIGNRALIRELQRELNTDVLLFGVDGFTYLGNLQGIEDCRIALLGPAIAARTSDVEILTPGGELRTVEFLRVDLWTIIGKGTGVKNDPIAPGITKIITEEDTPARIDEETEAVRQESQALIFQLRRMIGQEVVLTTLGGFLFEGVLGDVGLCLAILTVEDVFGPGDTSSMSDNDLRSAVINLNAITSVSLATTTPN